MFKGLKDLGDMGRLMRQAQEMQAKAAAMQEELGRVEVEGQAGAGLVRARMTAKGEMKGLTIDSSLMTPGEGELLADLVVAAVNDAQARAAARMQEEMGKLTAGMGLPPGMFGG